MNRTEAKRILIACRPGTDDLSTPEALEALDLASLDPELTHWWEQQRAWHGRVRQSFASIPVPAPLQNRILARAKIIEVPWWRQAAVWRAAAVVVALAALAVALWWPDREDTLQIFRSRMVNKILRQYTMDIVTNDMVQIRSYLEAKGAPADYVLPAGLERLPVLGAGAPGWQDRRASMVCIDSQTRGTLFLFVVDGAAVQNPPTRPEFAPVNRLMTVSWSNGGKTYVLAGTGSQDWLRSFF